MNDILISLLAGAIGALIGTFSERISLLADKKIK